MSLPHEIARSALWAMLVYARRAVRFLGERSVEEFMADDNLVEATIRRVEVVGEAASRYATHGPIRGITLPVEQIREMRNILVHRYDSLDAELLYRTVKDRFPKIIQTIERNVPEPPEGFEAGMVPWEQSR